MTDSPTIDTFVWSDAAIDAAARVLGPASCWMCPSMARAVAKRVLAAALQAERESIRVAVEAGLAERLGI